MVKKDTRMMIPLKDRTLQNQIKDLMERENLSYEEMMHKLILPDAGELVVIEDMLCDLKREYARRICNSNKSNVDELLEYMRIIVINTVNGKYQSNKILETLEKATCSNEWISSEYLEDD